MTYRVVFSPEALAQLAELYRQDCSAMRSQTVHFSDSEVADTVSSNVVLEGLQKLLSSLV